MLIEVGPDSEGVTRSLRFEAADEGLEVVVEPTVGEESLEAAMNTPQFGLHVKYRFLREVKSSCHRRCDVGVLSCFNSPINGPIVLAFTSKSAAKFYTSEEPSLSFNLSQELEGTFKA